MATNNAIKSRRPAKPMILLQKKAARINTNDIISFARGSALCRYEFAG
jgi:hypothetical protein